VPISANVGMPVNSSSKWQIALNYDLNVLKTFKNGSDSDIIFEDNEGNRWNVFGEADDQACLAWGKSNEVAS